MIVYKWVIKKDNKYYSLRNFNVDGHLSYHYNYPPYKLEQVYTTLCKIKNPCFKLRNGRNALTSCKGYHFWKEKTNECFDKWNKYLKRIGQPFINSCLLCEIKEKDIFIQNDFQLVAKKFKVLEEIKI